jgi:hypothetical protein
VACRTHTDVEAFSRRAQIITQLSIIEFIEKQVFEPMKLKEDQRWLAYGIEAVLSAHYMNDTVGLSYDDLLRRMTVDNPRNPIRAQTVDLLRPNDQSAMKPQWVPLYLDAYRIRSTRVVQDWLKKTSDSSISLTLMFKSFLRRVFSWLTSSGVSSNSTWLSS